LTRHRAAALGGMPDLAEVGVIGVVGRMPVQQVVGIAHRHDQQVVEVMGDAGDEMADGFHLLRPPQRLLGLLHVLQRRPEFGLAGAKRRGRAIPPGDDAVGQERHRDEDDERSGILDRRPAGGICEIRGDKGEHDGNEAGTRAAPLRGDRHGTEERHERRAGEQRPREARERERRRGRQEGEAVRSLG
jgi:hypothetical protein